MVARTQQIYLLHSHSLLLLTQSRIRSSRAKAPTLNMTSVDPVMEMEFGISPITRACEYEIMNIIENQF